MPNVKQRNLTFEKYAHLVRLHVQAFQGRLPSGVDMDDLESAGNIGLIDAIEKFDPSRTNKFETYADFRIRGSILDEIRSRDWSPRSVREKVRRVSNAKAAVERRRGRTAEAVDVAVELELSLDDYHQLTSEAMPPRVTSLDGVAYGQGRSRGGYTVAEILADSSVRGSDNRLFDEALATKAREALMTLDANQFLVMGMHYFEDLALNEVGLILCLSESRVSQLHASSVLIVKSEIAKWLSSDPARAQVDEDEGVGECDEIASGG